MSYMHDKDKRKSKCENDKVELAPSHKMDEQKRITAILKDRDLDYVMSEDGKSVFVGTDVSLWWIKYIGPDDTPMYRVMHHNYFNKEALANPITPGAAFHYQKNIRNAKFETIIKYIVKHDQMRGIEKARGVKGMPETTKEQKCWKAGAKKRQKKASVRRVYRLLDALQKGECNAI